MERTLTYAATYAGALIAAVASTPLVVALARRWGVVDLPNSRKVHVNPTPRLGGLAIAGSMLIVALVALFASRLAVDKQILEIVVVLFAGVFVLGVGLLDDLFNLPSKFKLLALIAAATAVCGAGVRIDVLHGFLDLNLHGLAWPVTILWIVGITVSINFIDGLDGLAAGIAAITCAVLAVSASCSQQYALAILALSLLGSLTGFLFFNFNPARVFMGDCGSMFIGFMLATLSVLQAPRVGTTVGLILPVLSLAVPILDTMLTMIRRSVLHRGSLFAAERGHIHHRLLDLGLGQRHSVLILYSASLVSAGVGLLALLVDHGWATLAGLALVLPLLLGLFGIAGSTRVRETIAAIRRNRDIGRETRKYVRAFESLQLQFRNVKDFDGWWTSICAASDLLDFVKLELPLARREGGTHVLRWLRADSQHAGCEILEATIPIRQRRQGQSLRAHVEVASHQFLETAGQRVALFARLMGDHGVASLPQSRRVRTRGPAGERSTSDSDVAANGNGRANGNGHSADVSHAAPSGNGHSNGNGNGHSKSNGNGVAHASAPVARNGEECIETTASPIHLAPTPSDLDNAPQVGISASLHTTDLPPAGLEGKKIAIVHDFLYCYAGAERVLEQILRVFPDADIFALFDFMPKDQRGFLLDKPVHTTFIQRLPFSRRKHRMYLPLMPLAIEQLDVSDYDIVISSSYLAAKGVLTRPDQLHVCYCHTPIRFAWDLQHQYLGAHGLARGIKSLLPRMVFHYLRTWDVRSANAVDAFITNSAYVGRRIGKLYRRTATTIYPPVDTQRFTPGTEKREDFYLTASRMVPYKRIDLIVEAFNAMPQRRLIVVGDGPEYDRIRASAGPNIRMVGHQPFEKLKQYMQLARAFVFAAEEDFGIVPVEAQSCGTPVIAFGRGGVTESVLAGRTGMFFDEQTPESIVAAVEEFERAPQWQENEIRENSQRFSTNRFRTEFRNLIEAEWNRFTGRRIAMQLHPAPANLRAPRDVATDELVKGENL